jgi:hypothetical protein
MDGSSLSCRRRYTRARDCNGRTVARAMGLRSSRQSRRIRSGRADFRRRDAPLPAPEHIQRVNSAKKALSSTSCVPASVTCWSCRDTHRVSRRGLPIRAGDSRRSGRASPLVLERYRAYIWALTMFTLHWPLDERELPDGIGWADRATAGRIQCHLRQLATAFRIQHVLYRTAAVRA